MKQLIPVLTAMAAGYAISIATWPLLRRWIVGVDNEIDDLRAQARSLERKRRG